MNSEDKAICNQEEEPSKAQSQGAFLLEILASCLKVVIVFLAINIFIKPCVVVGVSMYPTLEDGEYILVSSSTSSLKENDIIVFYSESEKMFVVKRVIANENKWVRIDYDSQLVYVSADECFDEADIIDETQYAYLDVGAYTQSGVLEVFVPEGYFFVMGDNRNNSLDSRSETIGLVSEEAVLGKVLLRISPLYKIGIIK